MKRISYLISLCAVLGLTMGCTGNGTSESGSGADSVYAWENIRKYYIKEPELALRMIDTAEVRGVMDVNQANHWRASIYYSDGDIQDLDKAKDYSMAVLTNQDPACDSAQYLTTLSQLVSILSMNRDDYPEAIRYAMEGAERAHHAGDERHEADFYYDMGFIMEKTQSGSGIQYIDRSLDILRALSRTDWKPLPVLASYLGNTARMLAEQDNNGRAVELLKERLQILDRIDKEVPTAPKGYCDERRALTYSVLAYCQWALGDKAGAKKTADAFEEIKNLVAPSFQLDIMNYYAFAGDVAHTQQIYDNLEPIMREQGDTISDLYSSLIRLHAMGISKAGRYQEAYQQLDRFVTISDSLVQRERQRETLKYVQLFKTQEKDAEIAEQQVELSQQRSIGTLIALVLITTFFIIYTWYRRRAENRLGAAHVQLQQAYDQLEETTAAKERIESELRIARDIQMSMVPDVFPKYEGLDMYAEMTPAKEVGGDLYGYVMKGDKLYFCVGDVSGKGVPASLFMAQSARLFRTLATEGMMPADIAVRMNNELTEGNDQGMFVTMFMGLLHLDTGRLDYCNCGHNPPILVGSEKGKVKSEKLAGAAFLEMQYENQPLGLWEDDPFYGESIDDIRGKQLLIYTDGLNEAENQQKDLLGNKRLLELMVDTQSLDSHQVIDMLKSAVEQHRAGAEPNDDLTLMCLKLN